MRSFIHIITTRNAKGEVLITIMASLTQQESQSLSQNVKLGLQFRYQSGQVQVNHNHFLGYTKDADGNLIIDPEQAEVVKRIYREYLEGYSMDRIAKGLEADGILTGAGKTKWWTSTINKILRNEKYIGDALLQLQPLLCADCHLRRIAHININCRISSNSIPHTWRPSTRPW